MADFSFNNNSIGFNKEKEKQATNADIMAFSDVPFKDGRVPTGSTPFDENRNKYTMAEILGLEILVTNVREHNSKVKQGDTYITIEFDTPDGEKGFVNTSGSTIRHQLMEKQIQYPFYTVIERVQSKSNSTMFYYRLT